jgi:hypothetical protein
MTGRRYEVRVAGALGPRLRAAFGRGDVRTSIQQSTVIRTGGDRDLDLARLLHVAHSRGWPILSIRRIGQSHDKGFTDDRYEF